MAACQRGNAKITDLSNVRLLRCGVDTVRQLYRGMIRPEVMALFETLGVMVDFAGQRWHSGRVGRDSGYHLRWPKKNLTHCPGWVDHYTRPLAARW